MKLFILSIWLISFSKTNEVNNQKKIAKAYSCSDSRFTNLYFYGLGLAVENDAVAEANRESAKVCWPAYLGLLEGMYSNQKVSNDFFCRALKRSYVSGEVVTPEYENIKSAAIKSGRCPVDYFSRRKGLGFRKKPVQRQEVLEPKVPAKAPDPFIIDQIPTIQLEKETEI